MKEMDCVEVTVEKEKYAQDGEKDDIAEIPILEKDLVLLPNGMDARVNERIKAQFED